MAQSQETSEYTTVSVQPGTWERLDELKERGDSFDDVINRVLDAADSEGG